MQKESARFEARVTKERKNFRENAPFDIKAVDDLREVGQAYTSIDKFTKVLLQLQSDAHDLNVLEDLFEVDVSRLLDIDKSWSDLRMLKGLYDMMKASILYYDKFRKDIEAEGYVINPYDPCVANKLIQGKHITNSS